MISLHTGYLSLFPYKTHVKPQNTNLYSNLRPLNFDTVSFSAKKDNELSFFDFKRQMSVYYKGSIEENLGNILRPQNMIGQGNSKCVYKIPKINDYVIAVIKREYNSADKNITRRFSATKDEFQGINFGQPVASDNAGLYILKKVEGEEYSLPMWILKYQASEIGSDNVSSDDAKTFFKKLKMMSCYPLSAYKDFAHKLKILNDAHIRIDTINPNNILIDSKKKEINLVDIDFGKEKFPSMIEPYNGISDMKNLLLDSLMHKKYYDKLSDKERKEFKEISNIIKLKCEIAGKSEGLKENLENSLKFLEAIQEKVSKRINHDPEFLRNYAEFVELYS